MKFHRMLAGHIGLTILSTALAATQTDLSVDEAVRMGLENSKAVKISDAKLGAAAAKADEAHAARLPSLKFEGGYRRLSDVPPFEIQPPGFPNPIEVSPTVLNTYNLRVGLQQPIFTGFKLESNAKAAEYLEEAARFDHRATEADLLVNIKAAYWTVYQTMEVQKSVDENVTRLTAHVKEVDNLMKAGMATRSDRLRIETQLSNARLTQIDASNDVALAMMNLNNVIGHPLDDQWTLTSKPEEPGDARQSESDAQSRAMSLRPDLQAMAFRVQASDQALSAVQGSWWPQVFLTGNYYYNRPNTRYLPTIDQFKDSWDIGIQLQFDIWNWNTTSYQSEQARAQVQQAELQLDQMRDNVTLEVKRALLTLRRSREKVKVARIGIDQADENVRTTNDRFKNGIATSADILDADVSLLQARTNLTGSLVESEMAKAQLERAIGAMRP